MKILNINKSIKSLDFVLFNKIVFDGQIFLLKNNILVQCLGFH